MRSSLWWLSLVPLLWGVSCGAGEPNRIDLFDSQDPESSEVACVAGTVCASPTPYCYGSLCVACLTDTNCGNKFCEPSSHTCVDCVTSGDCKNDKPYCFATQCRQCLVSENCGDETLACDVREGKCVSACQADEDCMGPDGICLVDEAICVTCAVDDDCPKDRPRCEMNKCVGCTVAQDCDEAKPVCDTDKFECVECLVDADCGDARVCDMRKCSM